MKTSLAIAILILIASSSYSQNINWEEQAVNQKDISTASYSKGDNLAVTYKFNINSKSQILNVNFGKHKIYIDKEEYIPKALAATNIKSISNSIYSKYLADPASVKAYQAIDGGESLNANLHQDTNAKQENYFVLQNYPNPFNPTTRIKFAIQKTGIVKIIVYDILGKQIEMIVNEELRAGIHETQWNASKYSSGVYFYKLQSGDYTETRRMTLIK